MKNSVLRLEIDGQWEPQDFVDVLQAVESLYYKVLPHRHLSLELDYRFLKGPTGYRRHSRELDDINEWLLDKSRRSIVEERILISQIQYASPGGIDFVGIGRAMETLERLLGGLIALATERNLRREADKQAAISTAESRESLRAAQIKNTRDALELWRDFPDHSGMLLPLADRDQDKLISRISDGKLKGVLILGADSASRQR